LYRGAEEVLISFDQGVCCHAWDGANYRVSRRGIFSVQSGTNVIDPQVCTPPSRLQKYADRGFVEVIPVPDLPAADKLFCTARDASHEDKRELLAQGGLKAIAAHVALAFKGVHYGGEALTLLQPNDQLQFTPMYSGFYNTEMLLEDDFRAQFLETYPNCRVHIFDKSVAPVYPAAMRAELNNAARWKVADPGQRLYNTEEFFNY
jgi:hypothetical protein